MVFIVSDGPYPDNSCWDGKLEKSVTVPAISSGVGARTIPLVTRIIIVIIANRNSLISIVNCEFLIVYTWLIANNFVEKCNFSIFYPYQKRPNYKVNLKPVDNLFFL